MKSKIFKICTLGLLTAFVFNGCSSDDENAGGKENQAPTKTELKEPSDKVNKTSTVPTFKWTPSEDPEKGKVWYELHLSKDKNFPEGNTKKVVDIKESQYIFSNYKLESSSTYYWKVVAYDKKRAKTSSDVFSFTTVDIDLIINILTPLDKEVLTQKNVELTWEEKRSSSYKDEITYSVFLRNGSSEFSLPSKKDLTGLKLQLNDLKGNGNYYWQIAAIDKNGNEITKSKIFSFTTPNTPPTAPNLESSVTEEETTTGVDVTVKWDAATDVDRIMENGVLRDEKVSYDVYLSTDNYFDSSDIKQTEFVNLEFKFTGLAFKTSYWAKIVVKDENGGVVDSNVVEFETKDKTVTGTIVISESTVDLEGKTYKTVTINGVTWLAENYAHIPYIEEDNAVGDKKICSVYGETSTDISTLKASANYTKYGVLYSGHALEDIAPAGWHVATDDEWKELEKLSGMTDEQADATGYKNGKRGVTMHKFIEKTEPFDNAKALEPTDEMKTSIKYGGYISVDWKGVKFKGKDSYTYFWTKSDYNYLGTSGLYYRAFSKTRKGIERNGKGQKYRMYVRLVKD